MVLNRHLLCLTILNASSKGKMAFIIALIYLGSKLVIPRYTITFVEVFCKRIFWKGSPILRETVSKKGFHHGYFSESFNPKKGSFPIGISLNV